MIFTLYKKRTLVKNKKIITKYILTVILNYSITILNYTIISLI